MRRITGGADRELRDRLHLLVSPIVFAERNAQERRKQRRLQRRFDARKVWDELGSKQIKVPSFDPKDSDAASEQLASWFDTDTKWKEAKWARICEMFGVEKERPKSRHISATIDWLIAASAPAFAIVVTDDQGEEFAQVARRASFKDALAALKEW